MFIEYWPNRKMRPRRGRTLDWMVIAINMKSLRDLKKEPNPKDSNVYRMSDKKVNKTLQGSNIGLGGNCYKHEIPSGF